jgi:hypothetical protein
MNALLAWKLRLLHLLPQDGPLDPGSIPELKRFAAECETAAREYERVWHIRSRPRRLEEILTVFERLAAEAREWADRV